MFRDSSHLLDGAKDSDHVGAKMGLDATKPLDADEMKFKRIRVPGEDEVDLARVVSASQSWRKAIGS
jgi:2,5-furandicarboxylate decarboxylase 1